MATKKKYKKLTNKEKQFRKELREEMREQGILPPVKPRLNRSKFAIEVVNDFRENFGAFGDIEYLFKAISWMTPHVDLNEKPRVKIDSEQIGVIKLMKLAMEIKKFEKDILAKGETKYSIGDIYEQVVEPVLKL
jgi:hypothetical protein